MKVLVSAASKHGAAAEVAEKIAREPSGALQEHGVGGDDVLVEVRPAEEVSSGEDYDAVVLGSTVYAGHWLKPARKLAEHHARALSEKPTWLFSVGPIGNPPKNLYDFVLAFTSIDLRTLGSRFNIARK
jgi:menaquinone-dependent protoporphyrinogen oxidase